MVAGARQGSYLEQIRVGVTPAEAVGRFGVLTAGMPAAH